jgi:glucose 1-dehydrogenase
MASELKGRVALVTGASLGIGRAAAVALGRAGAAVVVNYRSHEGEAEKVAQAVRAAGSRATTVQADVADADAVERMVEKTVAEFGRLDIAISNAAYSDRELFYQADLAGLRAFAVQWTSPCGGRSTCCGPRRGR